MYSVHVLKNNCLHVWWIYSLTVILFSSLLFMKTVYRDTYRIVSEIPWYVSYREVLYRCNSNSCNLEIKGDTLSQLWDCYVTNKSFLIDPRSEYMEIQGGGAWLIDNLLFYVPLENISLIWRRHHYRWRALTATIRQLHTSSQSEL